MNRYTMGWSLFVAMLGVMCINLGKDIAKLPSWTDATTPSFIGESLLHLGTVIGAFIGGKIQPS